MRYKINQPTVIHEDFDGEVVIINLDTGSYYSIERAGAAIWNSLENAPAEITLIEEVIDRYTGNRDEIEMAVSKFLAELERESLIVSVTDQEMDKREVLAESNHQPQASKLAFDGLTLHKYTDMEELLLLDPIHQVDETGWPSAKSNEHP